MKKFKHYFLSLIFFIYPAFLCADDFKVGVLIPMSGIVSDYGDAIRNGIMLALKERPELTNVKFIFEDTRYDIKTSISGLNKLKDQDNVDLIYVFGTNSSIVLSPIAEEKKLPMFALSGEPDVISNKKYVVDFHNRLEDMSIEMLNYLRSKGLKKIGIIKTEIQYIESLLKGFYPNLKDGESIGIIDTFSPSESPNFNTAVLNVKKGLSDGKYDVIGALLLTGHMSTFYKKLDLYKIKPPTFGCDVMAQIEEVKRSGSSVVGGVFPIPVASEKFSKSYIEEYHKSFQLHYAANAYDFANLILDLYSKDWGGRNADEVISKLNDLGERNGASGSYKFIDETKIGLKNPGKRFKFPIAIMQVQADGTSKAIHINEYK